MPITRIAILPPLAFARFGSHPDPIDNYTLETPKGEDDLLGYRRIIPEPTFQISAELRERHGYPEMTPALRAKIFGLNAANVYGLTPTEVKRYTARDSVARKRMAYLEKPDPHFRTYGPKTRREFLRVVDPTG